ncbi:hypothetical protein BHE74_00033162 [Ensete ventricosum]|uniref:Uncharacterized protein n=1 Tax=Ensete ventricosum TaxID=4639 RepID=A0A444CWC5_ENSVE|nr:hypothetical protein GW17_00047618 [Ensete ventricosum]RWW59877.1 hypothetical protein BHE74_00033162 [Ensete ventricosum]RZR72121.1 hypothetical protein BHM03_00010431 [Ensete ventricosum]
MDQHQHHRRVTERRPGQKRERVRVVEQRIAEGPVHARRRRQRERQHVQSGQQVDGLELLRLPHGVHDLPVTFTLTEQVIGKV